MTGLGVVARISIAPVKSLRLTHPAEVWLDIAGARGDRQFYLVDGAGHVFKGKRDARLVQIRAEYADATRTLTLTFPSGERVEGVAEDGPPLAHLVHGQPAEAATVVGPWSEAVSSFVGEPLTLVRPARGAVDRGSAGAFSLVSRASLDELGRAAGLDTHIDGRRFRMLFEVDGLRAHEEDSFVGRTVRIGDAVVRASGNVGRCVVTTRDPESGVSDLQTLHVLGRYRAEVASTEPLPFGVYGEVITAGRVRTGDEITAT